MDIDLFKVKGSFKAKHESLLDFEFILQYMIFSFQTPRIYCFYFFKDTLIYFNAKLSLVFRKLLNIFNFPQNYKSIYKFCMYYHLNGNYDLIKIHDPSSSKKSGSINRDLWIWNLLKQYMYKDIRIVRVLWKLSCWAKNRYYVKHKKKCNRGKTQQDKRNGA